MQDSVQKSTSFSNMVDKISVIVIADGR